MMIHLGDIAWGKLPSLDAPPKFPLNLDLSLSKWIAFLVAAYTIVRVIYNVYFHPLSKYPGPKLAIISGLYYWYKTWQGELVWWIVAMHEKYGEVVRLGPDRLSYTKTEAWKDIYGHRTGGRSENPKDRRFYPTEVNGENALIVLMDAGEHGRLRKVFSNAFSDRALMLQEPLIRKYVDQLVGNVYRSLGKDAETKFDMVTLYNCTTFDIMAELTFGEPLGFLDQSDLSPWVKTVFEGVKMADMQRIGLEYPLLGRIVRSLVPKYLLEAPLVHFKHSADRVDRRLEKGVDNDKPDIWNLVLGKGKDQLTTGQMHANASMFMIGGTETTATVLSGLTYFLLTHPDKLQKLVDEVRGLPEDKLTLEQLPRLPYLAACLEEALRLYPPTPLGSPREIAEGGSIVCGEWVPGKTRVAVPQLPANLSPTNFKDPDAFVPERWLPGSGYDDDRKEVLKAFAFGPRNCIGKNLAYHEMRIILAKALWHFDLELCPESCRWSDQKMWALWSKPPLWCKARPVKPMVVTI